MGKYLGLVRSLPRTRPHNIKPEVEARDERLPVEEAATANETQRAATKATKATKVPDTLSTPRDESGISDQREELRPEDVRQLLIRPPRWLRDEMKHFRTVGVTHNRLKALAASVAAHLYEDAKRGAEVLPDVEAFMTHGVGCDCGRCL